jgi:hypothetical protein
VQTMIVNIVKKDFIRVNNKVSAGVVDLCAIRNPLLESLVSNDLFRLRNYLEDPNGSAVVLKLKN